MVIEGLEVEYKGKNKKAAAQDAAAGFIEMIASAVSIDERHVRDIVKDEVAPLYAALDQPKIVLMAEEKKVGELPATRHPMAETLLNALMVKTVDGHGLNVWIAGPAGSGKTFAVRQVAKTLDLEYGFHGAMTMPHELVGFVDAGGTYHETVFVRLYRNGGVCLLDECDAGSSEALLTLNAALANGQMSLPTGQILDRHPDFRCVAAANTFGHGATAEYVGRAKIDAAFLDRFGVRLSWGYDEKLERTMCGNPDWATYVQAARRNAVSKGIKVMITPRASMSGAALIANGMSFEDAAEITFLSSLNDDQKKAIKPTGSYGSKSKSMSGWKAEKIYF
jgi:23S rRNA pseudoU1915 N3-methylase RlmH